MMPDFTFNEKTGELQRGGILVALSGVHTKLFGALTDQFVMAAAIGRRAKLPISADRVRTELCMLRRRVARLGIVIESKKKTGYRRVVQPMPSKWEPTVSAPVTVDDLRRGEYPSVRLNERQLEQRNRRNAGYDARDITASICGDPPRGYSALDWMRECE